MFGSFHIEMPRFGGLYILSENSVVAMGSMNKFQRGKVHNRCRRGHILLSVGIHGLHWKQCF